MYVGCKKGVIGAEIDSLNRKSSNVTLKSYIYLLFLSYAYFPLIITKKGCPIGHL